MNNLLDELLKPNENETLEYWLYKNRKAIFKIHLEKEGATWKKISQDVSDIFNLTHTLRTSEFLHILNSEFLFNVNQRLTYLL